MEYLLDCDILYSALTVSDVVKRIVFCSAKVMKGNNEYDNP